MKVQCEFCNSWIDDTDEKCPNCGGVNKEYKRATDQTPKTIEELKKWYTDHHLPPEETTRFFIGTNYQEPRAFGIYENEKGEFVVYKNKDNGQRAIRYQGTDEAYAVNELYLKLKDEILNQKRHNQLKKSSPERKGILGKVIKVKNKCLSTLYEIVFVLLVIFGIVDGLSSCSFIANRHEGYYKVDNKMLYRYYNTWYEYDSYDDGSDDYNTYDYDSSSGSAATGEWVESETDYDEYQDIWDYNLGKNYDNSAEWDSGIESFTDSYAYEEAYEEQESSSDSDSDWSSSDSWDSGSTDFGSDW